MKCVDSFVYGAVFGIMFMFIMMSWFPEKTECEVQIGNNKESHVYVGVKL